MHILVVEDEKPLLDIISKRLKAEGYSVLARMRALLQRNGENILTEDDLVVDTF